MRNRNDSDEENNPRKSSAFLSKELKMVKHDLRTTTQSLEQSMSMSEGLRETLRDIALDKQRLASNLYECQEVNRKLTQQINLSQESFQQKTVQMQGEINEIKESLIETKLDFQRANAQLRDDLKTTTQITFKLGMMFLRMKESKCRINKKMNHFEELAQELSNFIREQAAIIHAMARKKDAKNVHKNKMPTYFELLSKIGFLLAENAELQLDLATARCCDGTKWQQNMTKKYLERVSLELAKEHLKCYQYHDAVNAMFNECPPDDGFYTASGLNYSASSADGEIVLFDKLNYIKK